MISASLTPEPMFPPNDPVIKISSHLKAKPATAALEAGRCGLERRPSCGLGHADGRSQMICRK